MGATGLYSDEDELKLRKRLDQQLSYGSVGTGATEMYSDEGDGVNYGSVGVVATALYSEGVCVACDKLAILSIVPVALKVVISEVTEINNYTWDIDERMKYYWTAR